MHKLVLEHIIHAKQPSEMLLWLYEHQKLDYELAILAQIPQDSSHHPEGNVLVHTAMVMDEAAIISDREELDLMEHAILLFAAMCHDLGKATTTQIHDGGRITAYGHPEAGVEPTIKLLKKLNVNAVIIEHVVPLVREHMAHVGFYTPDITTRVVKRLMRRLEPSNIRMLSYVIEADHSGRGGQYYKSGLPKRMVEIRDVANNIDVIYRPDPIISGDDIMAALGIGPSRELGQVKDMLYKAQLDGKFKDRNSGLAYMFAHVRKV